MITAGEGGRHYSLGPGQVSPVVLASRSIPNEYLRHAERLWQNATASGKKVDNPHLLLSALEKSTRSLAKQPISKRRGEALMCC